MKQQRIRRAGLPSDTTTYHMKNLYLLTFLLFATCLGAAADDFYLTGYFNNWVTAQPQCKFAAQDDGTYTLDYDGTLTSGIKITSGSWDGDNYGGSRTLVAGELYHLERGSSSGIIPLAAGIENPHLIFNPDAKTLIITPGESDAGINDTFVDDNNPAIYYNLNGIRIDNPSRGIFIRRQGSSTTKITL